MSEHGESVVTPDDVIVEALARGCSQTEAARVARLQVQPVRVHPSAAPLSLVPARQ